MSKNKLHHILEILHRNFIGGNISYALIGAMALSAYGLPRFTSDIDILVDYNKWPDIQRIMQRLGYTCFQKSESFAQFDSEAGILGRVDLMLVTTDAGRGLLGKSIFYEDALLGAHFVIRPTDYIILKLMAMANNPARSSQDEADIAMVLNAAEKRLLPETFGGIDFQQIRYYADRFKQQDRLRQLMNQRDIPGDEHEF